MRRPRSLGEPDAAGGGLVLGGWGGSLVGLSSIDGQDASRNATTTFRTFEDGRLHRARIEVTGGRVLGKEGAEGLYVMAVRGPVALGVAFKIADGQERARDGVAMELLRQIGSLSAGEFEELSPFYRPVLRNHRGIEIGDIVCDFELEEA